MKIYQQELSLLENRPQTSIKPEKSGNSVLIYRFDQVHANVKHESLILSRIVACLLFILVLPVMAICIVLTRLTSKGPAIYRQQRVGYQGKIFTLYKIRSMKVNAESKSGAVWARSNDPRVTNLGKFLRWSHLDELPQLFNVLKGEMSFIGPRPERPEFVKNFVKNIHRYDERLNSHPGITGIAQVCLPADDPDAGLKTVCDKLSLEIAYQEQKHEHRLLDLRILIATGLKMLGIPRQKYTTWLALNKVRAVEVTVKQTERRVAA